MVRSFFDGEGNRVTFGSGKDPLEKLAVNNQRKEIASYYVERWDVLKDVGVRLRKTHTPDEYADAKYALATLIQKYGRRFMNAAKSGDSSALSALLEQGFPVNAREPSTSFTALHHSAAHSSEDAVDVLLGYDELDLLKRDGFGRLASELAGRFGENPDLADRLRMREAAQAQERGIVLTFRPRPSATKS